MCRRPEPIEPGGLAPACSIMATTLQGKTQTSTRRINVDARVRLGLPRPRLQVARPRGRGRDMGLTQGAPEPWAGESGGQRGRPSASSSLPSFVHSVGSRLFCAGAGPDLGNRRLRRLPPSRNAAGTQVHIGGEEKGGHGGMKVEDYEMEGGPAQLEQSGKSPGPAGTPNPDKEAVHRGMDPRDHPRREVGVLFSRSTGKTERPRHLP